MLATRTLVLDHLVGFFALALLHIRLLVLFAAAARPLLQAVGGIVASPALLFRLVRFSSPVSLPLVTVAYIKTSFCREPPKQEGRGSR